VEPSAAAGIVMVRSERRPLRGVAIDRLHVA